MIIIDGIKGIEYFGRFVPVYGLMIVIGLLATIFIAILLCNKFTLDKDDMIIIVCAMGIGGYIGSKLLFVLVSFDIIDWTSFFSFQGLHAFLSSGFVFYGGLIGALAFGRLASKKMEVSFIKYLIIFFTLLPLGHSFGRIGCYLAGCCYGVPYDGIGSVTYHGLLYTPNDISLFPVQLLEALCNLMIFIILIIMLLKYGLSVDIIYGYFGLYGVVRFFLEFLRYDELRKIYFYLSTSQWISLLLISIVVAKIIFQKDLVHILFK